MGTARWFSSCCLLVACGLSSAFIAVAPTTTCRFNAAVLNQRSTVVFSSKSNLRMGATNEELQVAVANLVAQVEDLSNIVRNLAGQSQPTTPATFDAGRLNGAEVDAPSSPPSVSKPVKGNVDLVSTTLAEERINQWLAEQGGVSSPAPLLTATAAPVAEIVVNPPPAPPAVPAAPMAPETDASGSTGFKVKIDWDGTIHEVTCDAETTLLEAAMDAGVELPSSCMSGSCLTCPGKLVSGRVDQSEGVLEEEQTNEGYILTCVSYPESDVHFKVIAEDELP